MAKYCMKCGAAVTPGKKFCEKCGTPLTQEPPAQPQPAQAAQPAATCPHCGAAVTPGKKFCLKCGTPLTQEPPAQTAQPAATCPHCGAAVTPGKKFCLKCGAPLTQEPPAQTAQPAVTCPHCGATVTPGKKFCLKCGAPLTQEPPAQTAQPAATCPHCGAAVTPGKKFCLKCGAPLTQEPPAQPQPTQTAQTARQVYGQAQQTASQVQQTASKVQQTASQVQQTISQVRQFTGLGGSFSAPSGSGEMSFDLKMPELPQMPQAARDFVAAAGVGKTLLSGVGGVFTGLFKALKQKNVKAIIPALLLAVLWIWQALNPSGDADGNGGILGFLTFAREGKIGNIGNILGQGSLAAFVSSLIGGGGALGAGFKNLGGAFKAKGGREAGALFLGVGAALIAQNVMAGEMALSASMAAISGFFLSIQTLGRKTGFVKQLAGSLFAKKGSPIDSAMTNSVSAGLTTGFALAIPLSAMAIDYSGYVLGLFVFLVGIVMVAAGKRRTAAV
ncbi:hypothetical protein FACS1894219_04220 [Clostridia bacterium]|nr:hypothetical protein FACS1894219_04220 [Clostridia bacterium]